jgi:hypothetical protein|tara:strand:+ start:2786 stop:3013 length:228 start_codon:yes stop_codon:yes gene_type:complete
MASFDAKQHAQEHAAAKRQAFPPRFKIEVQADASGTWAGNALRFDTRAEAEDWARNLASRWTAVREWRVVEEDAA